MMLAMAAPSANAYPYHSAAWYRHHHVAHHERVCRNRGTGIGIVAGALLGNSLAGRNRTTGTLAGAAVGGVAGHAIAQDRCEHRYR